jgi:putative sigma-54 modulation protein
MPPASRHDHSTNPKETPMRIETHGQQMEITPALRTQVETKLGKLKRHFDQPCEVRVVLGTDKPDYTAEAHVQIGGTPLHAKVCAHDMYAAIDLLADKLDRVLLKHKERGQDHPRGGKATRDGSFG